MPKPIWLAHGLMRRHADVRVSGALPWLRPDRKTAARRRNSASLFTRTCYGMPAATRSPMMAMTLVQFSTTWAIGTFRIRCDTRSSVRRGSRTFGKTEAERRFFGVAVRESLGSTRCPPLPKLGRRRSRLDLIASRRRMPLTCQDEHTSRLSVSMIYGLHQVLVETWSHRSIMGNESIRIDVVASHRPVEPSVCATSSSVRGPTLQVAAVCRINRTVPSWPTKC
jgi:hypothetical protein